MPKQFEQLPLTVTFCIDFRYDNLGTEYLNSLGIEQNYYLSTTAGASLPYGYENYCCTRCSNHKCDPNNSDMKLLKDSLLLNLEITKQLSDVKDIYLLNHQDCGAFKAYLGCSGYPDKLGENNSREIEINAEILTLAKETLLEKYPDNNVCLGLIDINGSVADYIPEKNEWVLRYTGPGTDPRGLWYDYPFCN